MRTGSLRDGERLSSPIRRLVDDRARWRVLVQTWHDQDRYYGRFVFEPDGDRPSRDRREGPAALSGISREDVLRSAHDVPEERLRALLHSLS